MWTELRQVARAGFRPWSFSSAVILTIALCATASATRGAPAFRRCGVTRRGAALDLIRFGGRVV